MRIFHQAQQESMASWIGDCANLAERHFEFQNISIWPCPLQRPRHAGMKPSVVLIWKENELSLK